MGKTLFIADDSKLILNSLIKVFSNNPDIDIVGTAMNVEEAKKSIRKLKPDIIILDYQFKVDTGIDVLKYIRDNKYKSIVLIYTNFGYPELREECFKKGADFFFEKLKESDKLILEINKISKNNNYKNKYLKRGKKK